MPSKHSQQMSIRLHDVTDIAITN